MKLRGFEEVKTPIIQIPTKLPLHGSQHSCAFDFYSKEKVALTPKEKHRFTTDVKAYMQTNEYLEVVVRSSIGMKRGLRLTNQVAKVDADFYSNFSNDGNISIELQNTTDKIVSIEIGERIAQGIFMEYLMADEGSYSVPEDYIRTGGIGHTNEK